MKDIVIWGTSSQGLLVYHQLQGTPGLSVVGFVVDDHLYEAVEVCDCKVVPTSMLTSTFPTETHEIFIGIGYSKVNGLRAEKFHYVKKLGFRCTTTIHQTAIIYPGVTLGENCLVGPYTVIQPGVKIGDNVLIRDHCHIGHDSVIEDHCFISSHVNLSGRSHMGEYCFLGSGSILKEDVTLGEKTILGAGVTMLKNSKANEVYYACLPNKYPFGSSQVDL